MSLASNFLWSDLDHERLEAQWCVAAKDIPSGSQGRCSLVFLRLWYSWLFRWHPFWGRSQSQLAECARLCRWERCQAWCPYGDGRTCDWIGPIRTKGGGTWLTLGSSNVLFLRSFLALVLITCCNPLFYTILASFPGLLWSPGNEANPFYGWPKPWNFWKARSLSESLSVEVWY